MKANEIAKAETNKQTKNFLEKNWITIVTVAGAIGIVYFGKKLIDKSSDKLTNILDDNPYVVDGVGSGYDPNLATISMAQAKNLAQQLLDAMDAWGTETDRIEWVFEYIKNKHDFLMVFNAFGLQEYTGSGLPPSGWLRHLTYSQKRNLVYWLDAELGILDKSLRAKIKPIINAAGFAFN